MRKCLLVGYLAAIVCCSAWAMVDVSEIGVGARPLGLGRAFAGGMDDASSIFSNPAGLPLNKKLNIISMSGTILADVNYTLIGAAEYSPVGKLGVGYLNASVTSIPLTTITGSGSTATVVKTGTTDYSSSVVFVSYGAKLNRFLKGGRGENISIGGSLKMFQQGFTGGGTVMQNAAGNGADADIGLIWGALPWAKIGLTFKNCLPKSFGGRFKWESNAEYEGIAMSTRLGGKFRVFGDNAMRQNDDQELILLLDRESGGGENRPAVWHAGLEFWPLDILAFRAGVDQRPKADEGGIGIDNNFTAGVGIKHLGFTFDYAYHQFGDLPENTTQFFSIGFRGKDDLSKKYERRRKGKKGFIPLPEVVPKPELMAFNDLPEDFWAKKPIEYLASMGIMGGYPDQTFRPNQALSRGELAVLLVKAKDFKVKRAAKQIFVDVKPSNWMAPYINAAVKRNYMGGYPGGAFRPDQGVTRAEAAVIFSKFSGLYVKSKVQMKVFPDVSKWHWASPAIAASKEVGFFEYLVGKNFGPQKYLTRAEAAEILSKTPYVKKRIKKFISGEG